MSVATLERRLEAVAGKRAVRFVEFLGVGATGMVIDLAVTTSALDLTHYLVANVLGFLVAVTWNFGGNWWFVFDRPDGSIPRQYASYVGLHAATFAIRAVVLAGLIEAAGVPVLVATIVGIGAAAIANYLGTERILEDGLEWFNAVAAVNSAAHVVYHSRLRRVLRNVGIYSALYGAYSRLLATIYREAVLEIEAADAEAEILTETPPEIVSVLHTLEKERPVLEAFVDGLDADATVWDVGANLGVYAVLAEDVADQVIAVEPVPSTADRLDENLRLNGADGFAIGIALGDESGETELALERNELGTQTPTVDDNQIDARDEITVDVEPGDDLVAKRIIPKPDVLKVDVEGAEAAVLDGLEYTLENLHVDRVLVETHTDVDGVRERLETAGFDVDSLEHAGQSYLTGRKP